MAKTAENVKIVSFFCIFVSHIKQYDLWKIKKNIIL
jgi:hypothetical protein